MSRLHSLLLIAIGAASAGCSGMFVSHQVAPLTYALHAPSAAAATARIEATLVVARPLARPGLESDHIAVALADHRVDAYAGGRWNAPLPDMLEAVLLDALRATGAWQGVISERAGFSGRYLLQPEIREFSADYAAGGAPVVRVTLAGEFGTTAGPHYAASVTAHAEMSASADRQRDVVAAFQSACDRAMLDLVAAVEREALAAEHPVAH